MDNLKANNRIHPLIVTAVVVVMLTSLMGKAAMTSLPMPK